MQKLHLMDSMTVQVANEFSEELYKVIYKRPSDLSLKADVPVCCNILICDTFDEGAHMPTNITCFTAPYLSCQFGHTGWRLGLAARS